MSSRLVELLGLGRAEERDAKTALCNLRMVEYYGRAAAEGPLAPARPARLRRARGAEEDLREGVALEASESPEASETDLGCNMQ